MLHPNMMDPTRWLTADATAADDAWTAPRARRVTVERLASGCILYRVDFGPESSKGLPATIVTPPGFREVDECATCAARPRCGHCWEHDCVCGLELDYGNGTRHRFSQYPCKRCGKPSFNDLCGACRDAAANVEAQS